MNRIFGALLALLLLFAANQSNAAVVERDWKTPGDGLLMYDDVNRREWLDLSESLLSKFSGTTLEDRYQDAITELAPGGVFEGFTVAKIGDSTALAVSAGIDTSTTVFAANQAATTALIGLLDPTYMVNRTTSSQAFLDEIAQGQFTLRVASVFIVRTPTLFDNGTAGLLYVTGFEPETPSLFGLMLYRNMPEPSSTVLVVNCVGVFIARSWRRRLSYHL
jgi:hypothetical protein